jgi:hypothetical protein
MMAGSSIREHPQVTSLSSILDTIKGFQQQQSGCRACNRPTVFLAAQRVDESRGALGEHSDEITAVLLFVGFLEAGKQLGVHAMFRCMRAGCPLHQRRQAEGA